MQSKPWRDHAEHPLTAESLQWRFFRAAVDLLVARGNRVCVYVAPFNPYLQDDESRARYDAMVGAMVGDYVTAGTTIFILVDANQTEAIAMIDEVDVNRVAAGQTAMITLDAIPGVVINGTVKAISPQATIAAGVVTYKASVEISPEAGIQLRDGMTVRVDIVVANKINVLVVPNAAITKKGSDRVVEVALDGGKTEERVVTIGVSDATSTEILSGLQAGERVMVPGN